MNVLLCTFIYNREILVKNRNVYVMIGSIFYLLFFATFFHIYDILSMKLSYYDKQAL